MGMRSMGVTVGALTAFALGMTLLTAPSASAAREDQRWRPAGAALPEVRVTLTVDDKRLTGTERATFSARLLNAVNGAAIPGEDLMLQWRRSGATGWQEGTSKTTGTRGRVTWSGFGTKYSARYRVVHLESAGYASGVSEERTVVVKPTMSVSLRRDWVRPDGAVRLSGDVQRAYPGERVALERRDDGRWVSVKRAELGRKGRFTFLVGGRASYGPQRYRVSLREQPDHLGATSGVVQLTTVRLVTYHIETRGKVRGALDSFRKRTAEIYADPRGWSRAHVHFKRVKSGGAFSLVLSQARYVPTFASICSSYYSCRVGRYVIINEDRWRRGTPYFKSSGGTLREYRAMVVNHETGHWFGLGHASCGGVGQPAPVMMQQSKGLYGCTPNPWPLVGEIARAY
jgi:hypothetical protein